MLPSQIYQNTNTAKPIQSEDPDQIIKPKKFAVTSNNFYRTSHEAPQEQGGSLQSRSNQGTHYKQYGINLSGQAAAQASGSRDPRDNNSAMTHN